MLCAIVVQEVEETFSNQKVASLILTKCRSVLEQDTEPPTTPDVQGGNLDSSWGTVSHRRMNG